MDASNKNPSVSTLDSPPAPVSLAQVLIMKLVLVMMLAISGMAIAGHVSADEKFHRLGAAEVRSTLIGKVVTDESHWADKFLEGGLMGGHQLGQLQTGYWKLSKNGELCVVRKVKTSETDCFEVWLNHDQVQYRREGILLSEGILKNE